MPDQTTPDKLRYPELTKAQLRNWLLSAVLEWYAAQGVSEATLSACIQWIFSKDNKTTIQWMPGRSPALVAAVPDISIDMAESDLACRRGQLGCCSCAEQDYWVMQADPDRPPQYGFAKQRMVLLRGGPPTSGVHAAICEDRIVAIVPLDF